MASLGHLAVGFCAARMVGGSERGGAFRMFFLLALSVLPDLDVIGFALRVPYASPFGHRGATHSVTVALATGLLAVGASGQLELGRVRAGAVAALVVLLHSVADAFTDGGLGVALLWPLSDARYFAPWRPMPVAPIGTGILSARGLAVVIGELVFFAPFLAIGLLWRRPERATATRAERRSRRASRL